MNVSTRHPRSAKTHLCCALLTALGLLAGCPTGNTRCAFDSECSRDRVCLQQRCLLSCTSDEECAGEASSDAPGADRISCQATMREQDTLTVCADPEWLNTDPDTRTDCTTDTECTSALDNPDARCGIHETCILPPALHTILITDTTAADSPLSGTEVLDLRLHDATGTPLGYARLVKFFPATNSPTTSSAERTGQPLDWAADRSCLLAPVTPGVQLGKGAAAAFAFLDPKGVRLDTLPDTARLTVLVRSAQCGAEQDQGEYRIARCVSRQDSTLDPALHCDPALAEDQKSVSTHALPAHAATTGN